MRNWKNQTFFLQNRQFFIYIVIYTLSGCTIYMMHAKFHQILSASFDDASKGHTYFGAKIVNFLPKTEDSDQWKRQKFTSFTHLNFLQHLFVMVESDKFLTVFWVWFVFSNSFLTFCTQVSYILKASFETPRSCLTTSTGQVQ